MVQPTIPTEHFIKKNICFILSVLLYANDSEWHYWTCAPLLKSPAASTQTGRGWTKWVTDAQQLELSSSVEPFELLTGCGGTESGNVWGGEKKMKSEQETRGASRKLGKGCCAWLACDYTPMWTTHWYRTHRLCLKFPTLSNNQENPWNHGHMRQALDQQSLPYTSDYLFKSPPFTLN